MKLAKLLNDGLFSPRCLLLLCYLGVISGDKDAKISAHQLHPYEEGSEPPHTHIHITVDDDDDDSGDGSGESTLTKTEWNELSSSEKEAVVAKFFKHLDKDGDNLVSRDEIRDKIFEELLKENLRYAEEDFVDIDEDNNGYVTWEEYYGSAEPEDELHVVEDELEKMRFATADVDGSLTLNLAEFKSFNYPYESEHMQEYLIKRVTSESDSDGDGKLTLTEFLTISTEFEDFREKEHSFMSFDTNKDGYLDNEEIVAILRGSTSRLADSETDWLINKMVPSASMSTDDSSHEKWDLEGIAANIDYFIESNFEQELIKFHTEL